MLREIEIKSPDDKWTVIIKIPSEVDFEPDIDWILNDFFGLIEDEE